MAAVLAARRQGVVPTGWDESNGRKGYNPHEGGFGVAHVCGKGERLCAVSPNWYAACKHPTFCRAAAYAATGGSHSGWEINREKYVAFGSYMGQCVNNCWQLYIAYAHHLAARAAVPIPRICSTVGHRARGERARHIMTSLRGEVDSQAGAFTPAYPHNIKNNFITINTDGIAMTTKEQRGVAPGMCRGHRKH